MAWTDKYIGIPFAENGRDFDGCDCGGLVLLALRTERGIVARDFGAEYTAAEFRGREGRRHLEALIAECAREFPRVDAPRPLDVLRFAVGGAICHVGLYVDGLGGGRMLHVEETGGAARLEYINGLHWNRRLREIRRHERLL